MITIQIDYDAADEAVRRARDVLEHYKAWDADFNGAKFDIQFGDGTCIVDDGGIDGYDVTRLFYAVQAALAGESEGE